MVGAAGTSMIGLIYGLILAAMYSFGLLRPSVFNCSLICAFFIFFCYTNYKKFPGSSGWIPSGWTTRQGWQLLLWEKMVGAAGTSRIGLIYGLILAAMYTFGVLRPSVFYCSLICAFTFFCYINYKKFPGSSGWIPSERTTGQGWHSNGNMAPVEFRHKYKLILLGDQAVGKTSIITRFMYYRFDERYEATAGTDLVSTTMYLKDRTVRLNLHDAAWKARFRGLMPVYIRDCAVALIVFDVASLKSFLNTAYYFEEVRTARGTDVVIVLVGNKTDLVAMREVSREEGVALAQEFDAMYMETSARSGFNVEALFHNIAALLPRVIFRTFY